MEGQITQLIFACAWRSARAACSGTRSILQRRRRVRALRRDMSSDGEACEPFAAAAASADREEAVPSAASASAGVAGGVADVEGLGTAMDKLKTALPDDALSESIQKLKDQQKALRDEKVKLTKDLRNAERRKKRLRSRARQLTDEDLVQVLMFRKGQKEEQDAKKAKAAASGANTSSASTTSGASASSSPADNP